MKKYAIDTNIVSYLLKGNERITAKIEKEKDEGNTFVIPPIVYYEINNWLLKNNSKDKAAIFKKIYSVNGIGSISKETLDIASPIYNHLRNGGIVIEAADILIAAWCIENSCTLVTNNEKHFTNIAQLNIENWIKE